MWRAGKQIIQFREAAYYMRNLYSHPTKPSILMTWNLDVWENFLLNQQKCQLTWWFSPLLLQWPSVYWTSETVVHLSLCSCSGFLCDAKTKIPTNKRTGQDILKTVYHRGWNFPRMSLAWVHLENGQLEELGSMNRLAYDSIQFKCDLDKLEQDSLMMNSIIPNRLLLSAY